MTSSFFMPSVRGCRTSLLVAAAILAGAGARTAHAAVVHRAHASAPSDSTKPKSRAAGADTARVAGPSTRSDSAAATTGAPPTATPVLDGAAIVAALPFGISGMASATLFAQDAAFGFGNGQNAVWAAPSSVGEDRWLMGGDVRNTRLVVRASETALGASANAWRASAVVEMDFFGGFNGTGAFSDEQPQIRLRTVFADLRRGRTTIRIGQAPTPSLGLTPVSPSHIAFPIGIGSAGVIGWREPGVFVTRTLSAVGARTTVALQVAAFRGGWTGPGNVLDQQSAGEAGVPQLETRLDVGRAGRRATWSAYAVAHYDQKDLSGIGPDTSGVGTLTGTALTGGAKVTVGRYTLQGSGYHGRAIGQLFGQLSQFGDIRGWGAWGQGGVALTKRLSVWAMTGTDDPHDDDVRRAISGEARLANVARAALVRYTAGPYTLGAEVLSARTTWTHASRRANQLALSVIHAF
ncbi:MAG TPA: hypothetical protein VEA99_08995 [Gemmatimonadaceae bacterium]|nr:hypothetical protein [Gemmatimonadaceae bacterium]